MKVSGCSKLSLHPLTGYWFRAVNLIPHPSEDRDMGSFFLIISLAWTVHAAVKLDGLDCPPGPAHLAHRTRGTQGRPAGDPASHDLGSRREGPARRHGRDPLRGLS